MTFFFYLFSAPESVFRAVRGRAHRHDNCKCVSLVVGHKSSAVFFSSVSENPQPVAVFAVSALFLFIIVRRNIVFAGYVQQSVIFICKALYLYISFPVDCLRRVYRVVENVDVSLAYIYFFYVESLRNAQIEVEIDFVLSAFSRLVRGYRIDEGILAETLYFMSATSALS